MPGPQEDHPSARVRLEVAFLADAEASQPSPASDDERPGVTVLVLAAEADVRRYVAECLRARSDLRVLEAPMAAAATELVRQARPDLLIVDGSDGLERFPDLRAVVIVDEIPYGSTTDATRPVRLLGRPFSGDQLLAQVDLALANGEQRPR
jgi:CheY-like chemotaxis protein